MANKVKSILDSKNKVTTEDIEQILNMQLDAIFANPSNVKVIPPLFLWGSPGIGKSSVVQKVCEDRNIDFIDVRLSQMEPCDVRGLPVPNKEKQQMDWFVNGMWPRDPNGKGIIFLDEMSSCDKSVQVSAYELVLDRRLGKLYTVPPGYLIVAAGNTTTDRAVAMTMSSALANRFMHVELEPNAEAWLSWGEAHDLHPAVLGFIRYKREMLFTYTGQNLERGWPSPRSWHRVSEMCKIFNVKSKDDYYLLQKIVYGLVGNGAGVEFMVFYKINQEFDDVLEYMLNPSKTIVIPKENDRKYALCASVNYLLWKGKDKDEEAKLVSGFYRICDALGESNADFASMMMVSAMNGPSQGEQDRRAMVLFKHPSYKDFSVKFGKALRKRIRV